MKLGDFLPAPAAEGGTQGSNLERPNKSRYHVRATKNGGIPVAVVKRKHHKVVVVSNIEGDSKALLTDLQRALGTGGVIRGGTVEIQGEQHLERKTGVKKNVDTQNRKQTEDPKQRVASIDSNVSLNSKTVNGMKPPQLKEYLAAQGLSTQGNRKELVARLLAAEAAAQSS